MVRTYFVKEYPWRPLLQEIVPGVSKLFWERLSSSSRLIPSSLLRHLSQSAGFMVRFMDMPWVQWPLMSPSSSLPSQLSLLGRLMAFEQKKAT